MIDLVEDARTHRLYALKRITCHGKGDERVADWEIEVMKSFRHVNLVPLEESGTITVGCHVQSGDPITEVLIVMPFYKVMYSLYHQQYDCRYFFKLLLDKTNHFGYAA